jgi:hypothetical protein
LLNPGLCIFESFAVSPEIVEEDLAATDVGDLVDWTRMQALDSSIGQCIEFLQAIKKPHKKETGHKSAFALFFQVCI